MGVRRWAGSAVITKKDTPRRCDAHYNVITGKYHCPKCNNGYGRRDTMLGHYRYECGQAPRFQCPYCPLASKKTSNIYQHVRCVHPNKEVTLVKLYWWGFLLTEWIILICEIWTNIISKLIISLENINVFDDRNMLFQCILKFYFRIYSKAKFCQLL